MSKTKEAPKAPAQPVVKEAQVIQAVVEPGVMEGMEPKSDADLLAEAAAIVASEVPAISDAAVHNLGQDSKNYGKVQSVQEVFYEALDRKTKEVVLRRAIRVDH